MEELRTTWKAPRAYPDVMELAGTTQGDPVVAADDDLASIGYDLGVTISTMQPDVRPVHPAPVAVDSPLHRDSFPYLVLYLLDPSIELFHPSAMGACVWRLKRQLEKVLVEDDARAWLRNGCMDDGGCVPRPILDAVVSRIHVSDLVLFDGKDIIRTSSPEHPSHGDNDNDDAAVLIYRDPNAAPAAPYRLYCSPARGRPRMPLERALHLARVMYAHSLGKGSAQACEGYLKARLQQIADALGVPKAATTPLKRDLVPRVQRALQSYLEVDLAEELHK